MPAEATITRRVAWMDTDAAGVWHHTTAVRWAEDAEAELHRALGIAERTFGATPRVRVEFDFREPLRFDDEAAVTITVLAIGETSIDYGISIEGERGQVASGRIVSVLIDRDSGAKEPWPDDIRAALAG
jgi:acyl-CoA thioester hydrolase